MITSRRLSKHKIRLDRGGVYYGYFQMITTGAILMKVFGLNDWYWYAIGFVAILVIRYALGLIDEHRGILASEQKRYADQNPAIQKIIEELNEIKSKL
jgi:hypothetical protein